MGRWRKTRKSPAGAPSGLRVWGSAPIDGGCIEMALRARTLLFVVTCILSLYAHEVCLHCP